MKLGRASNFEDLLQRTPGVFLQSENGAEVSKISIRGSGITSEEEPLGVMFLMDGLNFNQGDGETTLEDFDVASLSYAEVSSRRRTLLLRWRFLELVRSPAQAYHLGNPNRFGVCEFADSDGAELTSETGTLHAAER